MALTSHLSPAAASPELASRCAEIFQKQRSFAPSLRLTTARDRIAKLGRLEAALLAHRQEIRDALLTDFGKCAFEVDITELSVAAIEIRHTMRHLQGWMTPRSVGTPLPLLGTRSEVQYEPRGAALIISPWNFPVNLTMVPLASAIAAGCTATIKPSEFTPATSALMKKILLTVFDEQEVAVVEGDAAAATELLSKKYDHIFFTGSPTVGRIVMKAAADSLASVTLELGGKSPVFVDETADLADAAAKIAWIKCMNTGQICIAPDYLLLHESRLDEFIGLFSKKIKAMYGDTPEQRMASPDLARIVRDRAFERVKGLVDEAVLAGGRVAFGGKMDPATRYIEPTVLVGAPDSCKIWTEEIFGPLLPIRTFSKTEEAIAFMNSREKPLAQYLFSKRSSTIEQILRETSAGGTTVNDCGLHFYNANLPFGGTGNSGIGKSHGEAGFLEFSNRRAVLRQNRWVAPFKLLHPPYGKLAARVADVLVRYL